MSSSSSTPAPRRGNDRVLTIDWGLFGRRLRNRVGQFFTALRYRAAQTEYTPPAWAQRLRFTWFRVGLMLLAAFVFTQKQVDFTVSVGAEGLAVGNSQGRHSAARADHASAAEASLGALPVANGAESQPAATATTVRWSVDDLDAAHVRAYVNRFEKVAQGEEVKFSIPAPANMALAILNSKAGRSGAAQRDNNHFGTITADGYYENAWTNWRAHSEIVNRRYPELADNSVNYQQWVAALAKTNYSSDRQLANKIMDVVERFGLERL